MLARFSSCAKKGFWAMMMEAMRIITWGMRSFRPKRIILLMRRSQGMLTMNSPMWVRASDYTFLGERGSPFSRTSASSFRRQCRDLVMSSIRGGSIALRSIE